MNELVLMRKNLFRKPVRTTLLIVSILIAFLIYAVMASFTKSISDFNTKPNRLVTLSKINFTESSPSLTMTRSRGWKALRRRPT